MRRSDGQVRGAGLLVLFTGLLCAPLTAIAQAAPRGTPVEIVRTARISLGVDAGDPNQEFDQVVTPFLMSDGRVAVPMSSSNSIRVFRANGQFITSHGRTGSGPGEFRQLYAAWSRGDTIEAVDGRLKRITRFLPNGTVEVVSLTTKLYELHFGAGPLPDGWLLGGVRGIGTDAARCKQGEMRGCRDVVVLHRFDRAGNDLGEVAKVEGFARYTSPVMSGPEPLSPTPTLVTRNGRGFSADNLSAAIRVVNSQGQPQSEIRWTPERSPPVRETLRMVIDSAVARAKPAEAAQTRKRWEDAQVPEQLPVFAKFLVDDQGFIWVRPYDPLIHSTAMGGLTRIGPGGTWTILSPAGVRVGTVKVPDDLEPMQITANAVVGVAKDEFGVESVRVHELKRR